MKHLLTIISVKPNLIDVIGQRMISHVRSDNEPGQVFVADGIDGVADDTEDVETRQDRLRQIDVVWKRHARKKIYFIIIVFLYLIWANGIRDLQQHWSYLKWIPWITIIAKTISREIN